MAEEFDTAFAPEEEEEKKNKTVWIIVAVVAVILLCCCCIAVFGGKWLWDNGDQLMEEYGLFFQFVQPLI